MSKRILFACATLFIQSEYLVAQHLLESRYETIRDEAKKYNDEIGALYYKEVPIALIISRDKSYVDYAKYYMFYNSICVSETHFFPKSDFTKKLNYFTSLYGEPIVANSVNNWIKNDIQVTLTISFSDTHKKEVCQINYAKISSYEKIMDIVERMQTPYTKMVTIKTNPNSR